MACPTELFGIMMSRARPELCSPPLPVRPPQPVTPANSAQTARWTRMASLVRPASTAEPEAQAACETPAGAAAALGDSVAVGFGVAVAVGAGAGAAAGAGGGAGTGTAAAGLIRVCGWAGASGPKAPVGSSSARPDRLARSDRRIERAAASISAASATPIRAAAGVATPSGTRAGPRVTMPVPRTSARPAADRRPTVRHGSERPERVNGNDVPRWRPEAPRPVEWSGGVADIAHHRTTERPKSHIQVTESYTRTHPSSVELRHRVGRS